MIWGPGESGEAWRSGKVLADFLENEWELYKQRKRKEIPEKGVPCAQIWKRKHGPYGVIKNQGNIYLQGSLWPFVVVKSLVKKKKISDEFIEKKTCVTEKTRGKVVEQAFNLSAPMYQQSVCLSVCSLGPLLLAGLQSMPRCHQIQALIPWDANSTERSLSYQRLIFPWTNGDKWLRLNQKHCARGTHFLVSQPWSWLNRRLRGMARNQSKRRECVGGG